MKLENTCPHCNSRIWFANDPLLTGVRRRYSVPFVFRGVFKEIMGYYPLGKFIRGECEICNRKVAIFIDGKKDFHDKIVVLYRCTLTDEPVDVNYCNNAISCRACEVRKKMEKEQGGNSRF